MKTSMHKMMGGLMLSAMLLPPTGLYADRATQSGNSSMIRERQQNQGQRIRAGVRNGDLTRSEARDLARQEQEIQERKREMKADGEFTRDERREIHRDLNEANRDIRRERHDGERRRANDDRIHRQRNIDQRQRNQRRRIRRGVKNGQLTAREAAQLAEEQNRIRRLEEELKRDGLAPEERLRLQKELTEASQNIAADKHDAQNQK